MKSALEFDLPEDKYQFDAALNGIEWKNITSTVLDDARDIVKYGAGLITNYNEAKSLASIDYMQPPTDDQIIEYVQIAIVQKLLDKIYSNLDEKGLSFDEL